MIVSPPKLEIRVWPEWGCPSHGFRHLRTACKSLSLLWGPDCCLSGLPGSPRPGVGPGTAQGPLPRPPPPPVHDSSHSLHPPSQHSSPPPPPPVQAEATAGALRGRPGHHVCMGHLRIGPSFHHWTRGILLGSCCHSLWFPTSCTRAGEAAAPWRKGPCQGLRG